MKKRLWKILIAGLMILTLTTGLCACSLFDDDEADEYESADYEETEEYPEYVPTFEGPRIIDTSSKTMFQGEYEGWTIFVYLCGTNLEEEFGSATYDINSMIRSEKSDSMRFVVQTGGAGEWQSDYVDASKTQRFLIQNSEIELVDESDKLYNMGDPDTFRDFVSWGLENYGAEHNAFILWDHGCGSINGVCIDDQFDRDSLSVRDLDDAFSGALGDKMIDFIGFDACLMSTMEVANTLSAYATYMCASEEIARTGGVNYTELGTFLAQNPGADGAELGIALCDIYYESCAEMEREKEVTFSILELSKMPEVATAFDSFCKELCEVTKDKSVRASVIRNIYSADNFGGNNKAEGYTNMVDVMGIVDSASEYVGNTNEVKEAIGNLVIYQVVGENHSTACGLSMYYPLSIRGSNELNTFYDISASSHYCEFISSRENGKAKSITFASEPALNEDGIYGFTLDQDGLDNTESVVAVVYQVEAETGILIKYGETLDVISDWSTGRVEDCFDGLWMSLPDGQNLSIFIAEDNDDTTIYTSPVRINGNRTNLRIRQNIETGEATVEGYWDGIDEDGVPSRDVYDLEDGDVIEPVYYPVVLGSSDESDNRIGSKYTVSGELHINYDMMPEGDYMYSFNINDIFGNTTETKSVRFYIKDGSVGFYDE